MRYLPKVKLPAAIPHIALLWTLIGLQALSCIFALVRVQNVQSHQDRALRSIMCFAEGFVERSPHATPEQKRQAIQFYNEALSNAHLAPCSK